MQQGVTTEVGRHNKGSILEQGDDQMFYALGNKRPKKAGGAGEVDEEEDHEDEGFIDHKLKKGKLKTMISQSQMEEKKRQELDQILDEQKMKWERKQQQTQNANLDLTGLSL